MNRHSLIAVSVAAGVFTIAHGAAFAAESGPMGASAPATTRMGAMPTHSMMEGTSEPEGGMAGGGMKAMPGMKGMMNSCRAMMNGAPAAASTMAPKLPPGNEKLEFEMHAEMMQKMGEIAAKYADRIRESR